jgi:hypothetical protein
MNGPMPIEVLLQECGRRNINIFFRENVLAVLPDPDDSTDLVGFGSKIMEHAVREKLEPVAHESWW